MIGKCSCESKKVTVLQLGAQCQSLRSTIRITAVPVESRGGALPVGIGGSSGAFATGPQADVRWHVSSPRSPVGSGAGVPPVGSGGCSVAFAPGLSPAPVGTFPAPASSNSACRFPALYVFDNIRCRKSARRVVCPAKAGLFSGRQSRRGKNQEPGLSRSLLNFGWRTPGLLYEVIYVTPRQQPRRRAEPARPGHRPGAADRGSPGPAGSASPPPPARSPPSVESSGHHASA